MIVEKLKSIHKTHRLKAGNVSEHTKSAQRITKEWQNAVCSGSIKSEVSVSPQNNEKLDIVDLKNKVAYETKVSGKNTHHEFYKDLAKVLTYNEYQPEGVKISKLVFISEITGIEKLENRLDSKFCNLILSTHGLEIKLVGI